DRRRNGRSEDSDRWIPNRGAFQSGRRGSHSLPKSRRSILPCPRHRQQSSIVPLVWLLPQPEPTQKREQRANTLSVFVHEPWIFYRIAFRNSKGVAPTRRRNAVVKWLWPLKPVESPTSVRVASARRSKSFARSILRSKTY